MGKSKGKKLFAFAGLLLGAFNPQWFGMGAVGSVNWAAGIYGASLASTIWTSTHQEKVSYKFDAAQNTIDSEAMIPIIYGTRKWSGGLLTWQYTYSSGKYQRKDIILCEGKIKGVLGVTANCGLIQEGTIFCISNVIYSDATVSITETGSPNPNDKRLALYANGVTTNINLQGTGDIEDDNSNEHCCNIQKLCQYIEKLGQGWRVTNNAGTDGNPEDIYSLSTCSCYKNPINVKAEGIKKCSYTAYTGATTQDPPDNYEEVGSYKNCAYIRASLKVGSDLQGTSPNISAIVQGMLVYDPRTSTTAYSENPVLCLRDYILNKRYGLGRWITEDMLDDESFNEIADYCDEEITYEDAYGCTVTEPRYTLNIILAEKRKHSDNIQQILATFGGFFAFYGDKISLRIEKQESISYDFTDVEGKSNIKLNSVKFEQTELSECPNRYSISYTDPAQNWASIKVLVEDPADMYGRGNIINKDVQLTGCTNQGQALRLGRLFKAINRLNSIIVTFSTGTMASHLQVGDIITLTYRSITSIPFRILELSENKGVWTIKAQQYTESIYDDALGAQISIGSYVSIPNAISDTIPDVLNISASSHFRTLGNGQIINEAELSWTTNYQFYDHTEVYMLSDNPTWEEITASASDLEGTFESIGSNSGSWKYLSKSVDSMYVSELIKGIAYTFKLVLVNSVGRKADFDSAPTVEFYCTGKTLTPSTPTGFTLTFTDVSTAKWSMCEADIDFWELRTDTNTGSDTNLLVRTSINEATPTLSSRSGSLYLYSHNTAGYYSSPCILTYNKPAPIAPTNVTITDIFQGIIISCDSLPTYYKGVNVHVNDTIYFSSNNSYTFKTTGGICDIQVAYVDLFGEGGLSAVIRKVVITTVDPALIAAESLSLDKMDTEINLAISKAQISIDKTTLDNAIAGATITTSEIQSIVSESNALSVNGIYFRVSNSVLQFSIDNSVWTNV